jgi:leader peptidase (prepilin peptidase) / N-methyltransferase
MIRILGTAFAALLGLAFGSFLNVCLSRWPQAESVVTPASHCMTCGRTLRWWENIPLASWLALRGRCHGCGTRIGWRYPLVEAAVGALWGLIGFRLSGSLLEIGSSVTAQQAPLPFGILDAIALMIFTWLLVGLAVLDAEHLWLPDAVTIPGVFLGLAYFFFQAQFFSTQLPGAAMNTYFWRALGMRCLAVLVAAGLVLLIRWTYWLLRRREGLGLGDAKLMAMLAAWLGLPGTLLSFGIAVVLGGIVGILVLTRGGDGNRSLMKLPLGTFLCIGGIVSAFWGPQLIHAYLQMVGIY